MENSLKSEIRKSFFEKLNETLAGFGFKYKKSFEPRFVRKTDYGFDAIDFFPFIRYDFFKIEFQFSVRHDAITSVVDKYRTPHQFRKNTKPDKDSITMCFSLKDVKEGVNWNEYIISEMNDFEKLLVKVIDDIKKFGFSFFEKYSDLKEVNNFYNGDPENPLLKRMWLVARAYFALVLAKHLEDKELNTKIEHYRKLFETTNDSTIKTFKHIDCFEELVQNEMN